MSMSRFFWGVIIIIFGLLLLAGNLGLVPAGFWQQIWKFWPLVLIILGAGFIFGKEKRSGWFLTTAIVIILLLAGSFVWWGYHLPSQIVNKTEISESYSPDVSNLLVEINFGAADLSVTETTNNKALEGTIDSFGVPSVTREIRNGQEKIVVDQLKDGPRLWGPSTNKNSLDLKITEKIALELIINTGASKFDLNLEKMKLRKLDINCGASSGNVKIGKDQKEIDIIVKSGASSFSFAVPRDAGLNITNKSGLSSNNFESIGLKRNDKIYKSDNFDTATQKINISFETGASSIQLEQY